MKRLVSVDSTTLAFEMARQKLGHPVPESNFVREPKRRSVAADATILAGVIVVVLARERALRGFVTRNLVRELR
jgi:hypothetical protein